MHERLFLVLARRGRHGEVGWVCHCEQAISLPDGHGHYLFVLGVRVDRFGGPAHERAHLRHHHHLLLIVVDALAAALFWLPTFREARRSMPILLEMAADDIAARGWGREAVATALRKLTISPNPAGGLAAGSSDASQPAGGSSGWKHRPPSMRLTFSG